MNSFRIGHGYDIHRLKDGGELVLGGIAVAKGISPVAHSDGDVVIHAIVDALLGAAQRGDIGEHFPDSDPQWRGTASKVFLEKVRDELASASTKIINVDVTILTERPRLGQFKAQMRENLQHLLNCPVNIKAGTHEQCDAIGRGEAIAAHAVVLIIKKG